MIKDAPEGFRPHVSVVIPARNEASHIEACLRSVLAQDVSGGIEVLVADGLSSDETAAVAREAGARVVQNPRGITPAGLNRALEAARGEVIVRFDAHAEMPQGYLDACLRALAEEPGAVNVGGWREARGRGPWGSATAVALASRFGVGNPRIWRRPDRGAPRVDVDTVPLGAWPADALRRAGGWDEKFVRNQDFELNLRLRRAHGRVVFDPAIWSVYHPRESLRGLARQYWEYGVFKGWLVRRDPASTRPRQLAPLVLVASVVLAPLPTPAAPVARAALGAYALVLGAVTVRGKGGWRTAPVLATMHFTWVGGLFRGLAKRA